MDVLGVFICEGVHIYEDACTHVYMLVNVKVESQWIFLSQLLLNLELAPGIPSLPPEC